MNVMNLKIKTAGPFRDYLKAPKNRIRSQELQHKPTGRTTRAVERKTKIPYTA
jgi:hypothetical protein